MENMYEEAIYKANKLGAKGLQVIGIILPRSATDDPRISFIVKVPEQQSATDKLWYD